MTELEAQPQAVESAPVEPESTITFDTPETPAQADPAPAPTDGNQAEQKKVEFDQDQQRVFDDAIGKKTFKLREIEREKEALQQQLKDTQAQIPQQTRPTDPAIPDRYDFDSDGDYTTAIKARDDVIAQQAQFDANQGFLEQQQQAQQAQQQAKQQQDLAASVQTYSERATKLGLKPEQLQVAGQTVANFGVSEDVTQFILNDEAGPLITTYLAQNPTMLDSLSRMTPMQAAITIQTEIKPKAAALKPKTPGAPEPLETLRGSGVPPPERGPTGATFT